MKARYAHIIGGLLGSLGLAAIAIAAEPLPTMQKTTTTSTSVSTPTTTTTTVTTPTTTTPTVTTTPGTTVPGTPTATSSNAPRAVYDQEALKKMEDHLCTEGFKAYVGDEGKNVCKNWGKPPDLAYTCVWDKKGPPAYPATPAGPCTLDFSELRGNLIITKQMFKDNPPLSYGSQAQCCYRSASGQ